MPTDSIPARAKLFSCYSNSSVYWQLFLTVGWKIIYQTVEGQD